MRPIHFFALAAVLTLPSLLTAQSAPSPSLSLADQSTPSGANIETQTSIPANPHQTIGTSPDLGKFATVQENSEATYVADQFTAAYALDSHIAEAHIFDQLLRIEGRSPGQTMIVLVRADFSTAFIFVTVTRAAPNLPDSTWTGLAENANDSGSYEARFTSNPRELNDTLDYRTPHWQVHFDNTVLLADRSAAPGVASVWFPSSFVRLRDRKYRLTFLDDYADSSPISVRSTLLRGVHFSAGGRFNIHAGFTSAAGFESLLLPTGRQFLAGGDFLVLARTDSALGVTAYAIQRDPSLPDTKEVGGVATVFFQHRTAPSGSDFRLEAGYSSGFSGGLAYNRRRENNELHLSVRYRPRSYAVPEVDNLRGLQGEFHWSDWIGDRFRSTFSASVNRVFIQAGKQNTEFATESIRLKAARGFAFFGGASVSRFSESQDSLSTVNRLSLPLGVSYDRGHFGLSAQIQTSETSHSFSTGRGFDVAARWGIPHFQISTGGGYQTEALGVDSIYSAFPNLNVLLAQLGFGAATSTEELTNLLNDRQLLNSLGLTPNAQLQLVPRTIYGNLSVARRWERQSLEFDVNYLQSSFLTQQTATLLPTLHYRKALSNHAEFETSLTVLSSDSPTRRITPVVEISLKRDISQRPFIGSHVRKGTITGEVVVEDSAGRAPGRGVRVTLDRDRHTLTDEHGAYLFSGVEQGNHEVEVSFRSDRPFWYATPSKVPATENSTVDFRVVLPSAQLIAHVYNDVGVGLPDVSVHVAGPHASADAVTDISGKFVLPVTETGDYVATINAESLPDGYDLELIEPEHFSIAAGESKAITFMLPALRSLVGVVKKYDVQQLAYVPVPGVTVEIRELHRKVTTNADGTYLFRDLPAGIFTIVVDGSQEMKIDIPVLPQQLHQDIHLGPPLNALC